MSQTQANTTPSLKVFPRTGQGKSAAYRTRLNQMVPGVVYGPKMKEAALVNISPKELRDIYLKAGKTTLITLEATEGAPKDLNGTKILIKEIQSHALKNTITHVDLHQLDLSRKIRVTVPLTFIGKAKGIAEGGLMSIVARHVEIKCLPQDIPNHIDVDVSDVGVNESIHIAELAKKYTGGKFEFIYESDVALVAVVPPEEEKVEAPVEVAAVEGAPGAAVPGATAAGAAPAAGAKPAPGAAPAAGAKPAPGAAPAAAAPKAPAKK